MLGLEVSRLARSSSDWHHLLELCVLTGTLILDEDGLYDPATFNDRLLLGLKGTMSEAELYVIRARLQGGILNKARRAALKLHLPIGFCYDERDAIVLDPDRQVQDTIRFLFRIFPRLGSACATVRACRREGVAFPRRLRSGPHQGELVWGELRHEDVLRLLHLCRLLHASAPIKLEDRSRGTTIIVMETTQDRPGDNASRAHMSLVHRRQSPRDCLTDPLVRPGAIEVRDIRAERAPQVRLA